MAVLWLPKAYPTFSSHSKSWELLKSKKYSPTVGCHFPELILKNAPERCLPKMQLSVFHRSESLFCSEDKLMMSRIGFMFTLMAVCIAVTATISPAQKPVFEVASIKRSSATGGNASIGDQPGGRFIASYITLRRVIQFAYRDNQQFIGGPEWLDSERWDIEARAPQGTVPPRSSAFSIAAPDTLAIMVQSLLEERFQLKAHRETGELPLYELTVSKNGAKIKLSEDQTPPTALLGGGGRQRGPLPRGGIRLGRGDLEAQAQSLEVFTTALGAIYVDRPVVDKTGLKGLYDIRLQWTPDPGLTATVSPGANSTAASGSSIFNAIEEQLGLKLESGKGPLPVLVIDSIQRPSEN
jgi:uncharacterized protein (TIGR03435 family)